MDNSLKTQIRVGTFIFLGLVASIISILALGGDKSIFTTYYHLNAELGQVQGLNRGSVVSLSGMTVGNIEEIRFSDKSNALIAVMKIDKKYQSRIAKDSTVEIRTQGALGDKFVYINPGDITKGKAENGDGLSAAATSDLMGIISEKGSEAGKIFDVITELHKFMKTINNENRTDKMMKNFTEASSNFKSLSEEARALIGEIRGQNSGTLASTMKRLDHILEKIERGDGTLGALINDPSLHDQLKTYLGNNTKKQYFHSVLQNSVEKSK